MFNDAANCCVFCKYMLNCNFKDILINEKSNKETE